MENFTKIERHLDSINGNLEKLVKQGQQKDWINIYNEVNRIFAFVEGVLFVEAITDRGILSFNVYCDLSENQEERLDALSNAQLDLQKTYPDIDFSYPSVESME